VTARPALAELGLSTGKRARLHRILFGHGLRNGTTLLLPYDQGLEHGPRTGQTGCTIQAFGPIAGVRDREGWTPKDTGDTRCGRQP
jgi:DhnA family fructose-bisphosphate aldolase class Ia